MMVAGKPKQDPKTFEVLMKPDGTPEREYWHWGDMQIVRWKFSKWPLTFPQEPLWPKIDDDNHGMVEGMRFYPKYVNMTDEEFAGEITDYRNRDAGAMPQGWTGAKWDGVTPVWHSLDSRYDQVRSRAGWETRVRESHCGVRGAIAPWDS